MSGFNDSVLGGASKLIRQAIQSPNFLTGISGWSVNKDGSAEFNNLTIRGTFDGNDFIINSSGAFIYNGIPAAGNLIASIAPVAGTDQFGNAYLSGIVVYNPGTGASLQLLSSNLLFAIAGNAIPGIISETTTYAGNDSLQIVSPAINANDVAAILGVVRGLVGTQGMVFIGNAALNMATATAPGAPAAGYTEYSASFGGHPAYINSNGLSMRLQGAGLATFPGISVTQASLNNLATATIPANDAEVGAVYELEVNGNYTQATTTGTSLQLGAAIGGTDDTSQTISAVNVAAAGGTGRFVARVRAICVTTGVSGTWRTETLVTLTANATPGTSPAFCDADANTTITKSTLSNQTLALRAAWGSAVNNPSITSRVAIFKRVA